MFVDVPGFPRFDVVAEIDAWIENDKGVQHILVVQTRFDQFWASANTERIASAAGAAPKTHVHPSRVTAGLDQELVLGGQRVDQSQRGLWLSQ